MRTFFRRNEGYVLPYVLLVVLAVSLAAATLSTGALRDLKTQEAAIRRTQALYQAEGQVQRLAAQLRALRVTTEPTNDPTAPEALGAEAFWAAAGDIPGVTPEGGGQAALQGVSDDGTATVTARLHLTLTIDVAETEPGAAWQAVAWAEPLTWTGYHAVHTPGQGGDDP